MGIVVIGMVPLQNCLSVIYAPTDAVDASAPNATNMSHEINSKQPKHPANYLDLQQVNRKPITPTKTERRPPDRSTAKVTVVNLETTSLEVVSAETTLKTLGYMRKRIARMVTAAPIPNTKVDSMDIIIATGLRFLQQQHILFNYYKSLHSD